MMMTRFFMIVPALAVGLAASAAAQQVSEQDARQAGQNVLDAWNKTMQQKDAAAHAALFTEDAVQVTPQGLVSGRVAIESRAAEGFKSFTSDPSKLEQV
jgi:ketosteroid isomerase-like protein